jgi:hypothetical protein
MGQVAGFFLAFGLAINGATSNDQKSHDRYMDAARTSLDGAYIQSGLKPEVDKRLRDLEKKYVPKEIEKYGSATAIVIKVIMQKQLTLTWSF